jgi:hypothetical protein
MEKRYSETLSEIKVKKLLMWRERYSKQEYPYKVAFNLLYEMLVVEKMWDEIQAPYIKTLSSSGKKNFQNFQEAHKYVIDRSNLIARTDIHPIVENKYKTIDSIAGFNWVSTRNRVSKAQNGDNKEVREIELAYYFYTCGVELIYAWSALGYLGTDQEPAFMELTGMIMGGVDYSSYQSLINFFGQTASMFYKPLPNLF